jgi:hypothetical protein
LARARLPTCLRDPYIREKFTRDLSFARQLAREYFERFPKDRYETEVETWRQIQSHNIEFTMKRLREPIGYPSPTLGSPLVSRGFADLMGRPIGAAARGASADSARRHFGWTFEGPRALRPLTRGATANPELWLCTISL